MVGDDLVTEVEQLRAELEAMSEELEIERAHRNILHRAVLRLRSVEGGPQTVLSLEADAQPGKAGLSVSDSAGNSDSALDIDVDVDVDAGSKQAVSRRVETSENVYVFDDEDESREAFDEFFAAPDPHLDKVRGFLLD